jgi:hypothetical protein
MMKLRGPVSHGHGFTISAEMAYMHDIANALNNVSECPSSDVSRNSYPSKWIH